MVERLGRKHDLARPRELLGGTRLDDRRPTHDEFPATPLTTQMGSRQRTGTDPNPDRQAGPGGQLAGVEDLLHRQPAAGRLCGQRRQVLLGRPQRKQRVTGELHDIAAVVVDQPDQLAEAAVQQLGELLDTAWAGPSQPLGKGREAGDVGEQDHRSQLLALGRTQWLLSAHKTAAGKSRDVAGQHRGLVGLPRPSSRMCCSTSSPPSGVKAARSSSAAGTPIRASSTDESADEPVMADHWDGDRNASRVSPSVVGKAASPSAMLYSC